MIVFRSFFSVAIILFCLFCFLVSELVDMHVLVISPPPLPSSPWLPHWLSRCLLVVDQKEYCEGLTVSERRGGLKLPEP